MAILVFRELTFQEKEESSLETVSIEYKGLSEPCIRFSDTRTRQGIVPAEAGGGCKVAKTLGMDLEVVKAVKQRRSTF